MIREIVDKDTFYYCEHEGVKGTPYCAIPISNNDFLLLCRQCRATTFGIILLEVTEAGARRSGIVTPDTEESVREIMGKFIDCIAGKDDGTLK